MHGRPVYRLLTDVPAPAPPAPPASGPTRSEWALTRGSTPAFTQARLLGSDKPRSVDFPRWLIGGATSGRVAARTRRRAEGGLLRGFLSALGPIGGHPLGHRILLFGRHRTALPRRLGVGRGLRDRGGRSRRPPRGGAPSRWLRRSGGLQHLVDVVQCLDLRLQALDLTFDLMTLIGFFPGGVYRPSLDAFWGSGPSAFQWVRILAQREFSGQTEPASARRRRIPRERVQPRRSLVRRPQQPAAGSATPHPNSASESTNRTKSACREMDCFS